MSGVVSGVGVHEASVEWLRGRLAEVREELAAAKVARPVWEIETEIGELEYLLGDQT